jgi:hypothetical protein
MVNHLSHQLPTAALFHTQFPQEVVPGHHGQHLHQHHQPVFQQLNKHLGQNPKTHQRQIQMKKRTLFHSDKLLLPSKVFFQCLEVWSGLLVGQELTKVCLNILFWILDLPYPKSIITK